MVKLWVANTDPDWFDFLSAQVDIDEVNFWQPSGSSNFAAIQPGELFLFRLKSPRNAIGGYGIFLRSSNAPISLAWEAFGIKNGASSFTEMRTRVARYLPANLSQTSDNVIGCRIVVQPVFFPQHLWVPQPRSWSRSIVVGKTYSTDENEGLQLWETMLETAALTSRAGPGMSDRQARFGEPTLIKPRLGQGAFRMSVTDAYGRSCAVSGGRVLPALDAAHIRSYALGGSHEVSNGLLLRRDIHSVFDAGYVTVDQGLRFVVSDRVRTDFNNGNEYRKLHGSKLTLPNSSADHPSLAALISHNENIFLG